ncbi:hypothetical protein TPHA_0A01390 [Tetrapisispora phaffii CBS 4417]|uniref:Hsp90 chaperone protein kinase-targeting subunit n=1 Tax=Tetrapisispora phaffii (strain ATCC 24235 / CBS 4417 / NBRC 1672 / NRRL Y-8282 / UCD 70-5) TaxID=1071381 RepID=G8BMU4_TETPH|nr:hypothetical protein TPHA_0A01390 [Tetrapisispora phaffii CBS 4417]CCE61222.1 hypothetical protein TPHA_0A01390 [Tetrapisispora phaffii CBS 4417]
MAIDYSKWDKIELSDDSDVEVHPNVDKKSFIKWKQQSIHEKRDKRNQDIKNLETQVSMYAALNKRVDKLLSNVSTEDLTERAKISKYLNANFDKTEKQVGEAVDPNIPTYNEMVEDLFEQLENDAKKEGKDPKDGEVIKSLCLKHRAKIDSVTVEANEKLKELYIEKSKLISSEDMHTGFNSSFLNKSKGNDGKDEVSEKLNAIADKNAVSSSAVEKLPILKPQLEFIDYKDDVMKLAPETEKFGRMSAGGYKASEEYLLKHMPIISEQQKDALIMKAFDYLSEDNEKMAYQVVHQSELLSYLREIYNLKKIPFLNIDEMKSCIEMFFKRVIYNTQNAQGRNSFLESVKTKFEHIKNRVQIMNEEQIQEGEGVETIQLKSLDDSTELEINLPDFNSTDPEEIRRVEVFNKLPVNMQDAIKTKNLDKINDVLSETPIDVAESYLDLFNEADIIGVRALLENEDEFKHLKDEYNKNQDDLEHLSIDEKSTKNNEPVSTADLVD